MVNLWNLHYCQQWYIYLLYSPYVIWCEIFFGVLTLQGCFPETDWSGNYELCIEDLSDEIGGMVKWTIENYTHWFTWLPGRWHHSQHGFWAHDNWENLLQDDKEAVEAPEESEYYLVCTHFQIETLYRPLNSNSWYLGWHGWEIAGFDKLALFFIVFLWEALFGTSGESSWTSKNQRDQDLCKQMRGEILRQVTTRLRGRVMKNGDGTLISKPALWCQHA